MAKTLLAITTYNQSDYTKLCLDSISKLNIDLDVLVIDDFSSDNTIELCSQYNTKIEFINLLQRVIRLDA